MASPKKRPDGISILAFLWILGSIANLGLGFYGIIGDIGVLPLLSDINMPEFFRFLIPAEMLLNFIFIVVAFLSLYAVYGWFTAKSWSYHLALAFSAFAVPIHLVAAILYASAPTELAGFQEYVGPQLFFFIVFLVWAAAVWVYATKPHVKQYLGVIPTPQPMPVPVFNAEPRTTYSEPTFSSQPAPIAKSDVEKFCRYCGAENKTDADFCEKCGKKIG